MSCKAFRKKKIAFECQKTAFLERMSRFPIRCPPAAETTPEVAAAYLQTYALSQKHVFSRPPEQLDRIHHWGRKAELFDEAPGARRTDPLTCLDWKTFHNAYVVDRATEGRTLDPKNFNAEWEDVDTAVYDFCFWLPRTALTALYVPQDADATLEIWNESDRRTVSLKGREQRSTAQLLSDSEQFWSRRDEEEDEERLVRDGVDYVRWTPVHPFFPLLHHALLKMDGGPGRVLLEVVPVPLSIYHQFGTGCFLLDQQWKTPIFLF